MASPKITVLAARILLAACCVNLIWLMLGPFAGAEARLLLNDKGAHILAFYLLTGLSFIAFPRHRRLDIAVIALTLGAVSELAQMFTGRDSEFSDWIADAIGVGMIYLPYQIEVIRNEARRQTEKSAPHRRRSDQRRRSTDRNKAAATLIHPDQADEQSNTDPAGDAGGRKKRLRRAGRRSSSLASIFSPPT